MAEQAKQDAPPQDKKKLFIIIGAAVALLAILGGVAVFALGGNKGEKKGETAKVEEKKAEGGHGEGGHGESKGGEGAGSTIYPLEPFVVNIYDGQELRYPIGDGGGR